jgi:hypothetical protein
MEIATGSLSLVSGYPADPGVMVLDDFVTEEQEAQILNDLTEGEDPIPRRALPVALDERQAWQAVLDLQRLLRGISGGSPAPFLPWCQLLPVH